MSARLPIGTIASILGTTPKAIRHYHKLGLLAEPERNDAGYRIYSASDVLRLQRIKRLQGLGLSLKQIKAVLGDPDQDQSLWNVLHALRDELTVQIETLQARRVQVEQLLTNESFAALHQSAEPSPTLQLLREQLGDQLTDVDPAVWDIDQQLYTQMDAFLWSQPDYQHQQRELIQYIATHPEEYQQLLALAERIAALAHTPEASPEVERLAQDMLHLREQNTIFAKITDAAALPAGPLADMLGEVMGSVLTTTLSPAQQRLFETVARLIGNGANTDGKTHAAPDLHTSTPTLPADHRADPNARCD